MSDVANALKEVIRRYLKHRDPEKFDQRSFSRLLDDCYNTLNLRLAEHGDEEALCEFKEFGTILNDMAELPEFESSELRRAVRFFAVGFFRQNGRDTTAMKNFGW